MHSRHIIVFKISVGCDQSLYRIANLSNTNIPQKMLRFQDHIIKLPIFVKSEKQLFLNDLGKHSVHTIFGTPFRKENRPRTH